MTSNPAERATRDYLLMRGWSLSDQGPSGELWVRGDNVTVVPRELEVRSSRWERLVTSLAFADEVPVEEVRAVLADVLSSATISRASTPRASSGRVEMDVHLDGAGVVDHETSAYDFGVFVMRASESVKELVKSARGIRHHGRHLLVAGGPTEGSVRVTLREPDRSGTQPALFAEPPETAEGQALVFLSALFGAAESSTTETDTADLRARLGPLPVRARHSVARFAESVLDGQWVLSGAIRRGDEEVPIRLGPSAAQVLSRTSREDSEEQTTEAVSGTLDGWVWSASELTLITEDRRTIRVAVPMLLQSRVAELNAERETRVRTILSVYKRVASGTGDSIRTTYALSDIERISDVFEVD